MSELTLGSLFDGSGGFPLAGLLHGIKPLWASEIEPFPIRVTTKRIPDMKHYGDVSTVNGAELEPVSIITFGSPCTDMSIAGGRDGITGEQSILFFEAIRIIKEMRRATNGQSPRFCVWENVPGAFSSGKGGDYRQVLEEIVRIADDSLSIPMPKESRWLSAGEIVGDGFSVAWRTIDAQFWGVPQRRRRIFLVADFSGEGAGAVLFDSEGLSRHFAKGCGPWERFTGDVENGAGESSEQEMTPLVFSPGTMSRLGHGAWDDVSGTLLADMGDNRMSVVIPPSKPITIDHHPADSRVELDDSGVVQTLTSRMGTGGGNVPLIMDEHPQAIVITTHQQDSRIQIDDSGIVQTLTSAMGMGGGHVPLVMDTDSGSELTAIISKVYGISSDASNAMRSRNPHSGIYEATTSRTLDTNGGNPTCNQGGMAVVSAEMPVVPLTMKIRAGCEGGGKGALIQVDKSATLSCNNDQTLFVPLHLCPCLSADDSVGNSDPQNIPASCVCVSKEICADSVSAPSTLCVATQQSGAEILEDVCPTITAAAGTSGNNQPYICTESDKPGGMSYAIAGNMIGRTDKNGPGGSGVNESVSFCLTATDQHAVAYSMTTGSYTEVNEDVASTLMARDYKDPQLVSGSQYVIRRLIPLECLRLQGFPEFWCDGLRTETPTADEINWWADVFETHRRITGEGRQPKTRKQIAKWLRKPNNDAAEYKMWGNGVALPCVSFVLAGIVWYLEEIGGC